MEKLNAKLKVEKLIFSDDRQVDTSKLSLTVLVGPNNSGKSECLREIEKLAGGPCSTVVLKAAQFEKVGDVSDIQRYLTNRFHAEERGGNIIYQFLGDAIWSQNIKSNWNNHLGSLAKLFVSRLTTDERLSASNPVSTVNFRKGAASHPIHILQVDTDVENNVSTQFKRAFGQNLTVDRFGGSHVGLLVGNTPPLDSGEDRISNSYRAKLDAVTHPLEKQGDGMRAFATIVSSILAIDTASIILIDEPEAFLYPPQARMLGEFLASSIPEGKQVFAATHSREFLMGVVSKQPDQSSEEANKMQIIRIERQGDVNCASNLDQSLAAEISKDAVMRHSAILDGVFHERVVLCEADADCMFYNAILHSIVKVDEKVPDVLFVQSGGKHKMPAILKSLNGLSVPTDVVVDIDAMNEEVFFKSLVVSAGGNWQNISSAYKQVLDAVKSVSGIRYNRDLIKYFDENIKDQDPDGKISFIHKKEINKIIADSSAWGRMKNAGSRELPSGEPTKAFERLLCYCNSIGIWIVRVGELEGFCKMIDGKGQRWAQEVLTNRNLKDDSELDEARRFVREIWQAR